MNVQLLTWAAILAAVLLVFISHAIIESRHIGKHSHHIIEKGDERELLFIPGDPDPKHPENYDYDD